MTHAVPRALVFMNARNCAPYVTAALESLVWQTHHALHVLFVDDCSGDGTAEVAQRILAQHFAGRHTLVRNPEPWGKARNAHVHLRAALHQGDFVAMLDADDQLIVATILADLAAQYEAGFDVVWTNFETDQGQLGSNGPLDPFRPPRSQGWKTSHFFTFRACLFEGVPEDHLQDENGAWLDAACDRAIAVPVLDQTRRYAFLPVRAYRYTASNPLSHHNLDPQSHHFSSRRQTQCAQTVQDKPPLPCRRWLFGTHAAADQAVSAMFQQLMAVRLAGTVPALPGAAALPREAACRQEAAPEADAWALTAAATLNARCPGLLALALDGQGALAAPAVLWAWWQWLQRAAAPPRVLVIGAGPLAAALNALAAGLAGHVTVASSDHAQAMALYARLDSLGLEPDVLHTPLARVDFEGVKADFPNLELLPPEANRYDLAVVAADDCTAPSVDLRLALPMLVPRLNAERFRVCLWSPHRADPRRQAQAFWQRLAPDFVYADQALGGSALVVHSA